MHLTIPFLGLLSTSALALPRPIKPKRQSQPFSSNAPLGASEACPTVVQELLTPNAPIFSAPPNYPSYACLPMSTTVEIIGINLAISNSTALQVYSDQHCTYQIAFIEEPPSMSGIQFCARQSQNGGKSARGRLCCI